jgi:BirA family transcriptional regulator, biotin operon repressor / biotin---[acetyl-CoA-carboxylase] ligase
VTWLGLRRVDLERCGSTNDEADRLARAGAAHGTVVTALAQDAGRGRRGRAWHSPPGENLYLSCVLRPALGPSRVPPLTLAAGLAVCEAVNAAGARASLKWPNDVLIGRKKVAGILTEMSSHAGVVDHVICGLGVNLATRAFPPELADRATSILLETGAAPAREPFIAALLTELESWLDRFFAGGVAAVREPWLARCAELELRVEVQGRPVTGRARELDPDGALVLEDGSGHRHRVVAGEVELLPFPPCPARSS